MTRIASIAVFFCASLLPFGNAASKAADAPAKGDYFHTGAGAHYLERAKGEIDRRDFGMTMNLPLPGGGDVVGNHVTLTLDV